MVFLSWGVFRMTPGATLRMHPLRSLLRRRKGVAQVEGIELLFNALQASRGIRAPFKASGELNATLLLRV
jgi:hypothetical protein